jgi:hypothetical protein
MFSYPSDFAFDAGSLVNLRISASQITVQACGSYGGEDDDAILLGCDAM